MGIKDKIYRYSPLLVKRFMLNAIAYQNSKNRYSKQYFEFLNEYSQLWTQNREVVLQYQREMLTKLLTECLEFVPYYKDDFTKKNIKTNEIQEDPYAVLNRLSVLPKMARKTEVENLVNQNPERQVTGVGYTSGTSGSPTKNYTDKESTARAFALWTRFHKNIGLYNKEKNVRFSGRLIVEPTRNKPPFWMYNMVEKQLFMSTYHLKTENLKYYVDKLNSFKPQFLDGYPSALYILAQFINTSGTKLRFTPTAIATTAETLYDYQRLEIEKAFNCKVYNQYASSEGSPFITECKEGKLHVNEDSGIFEFLDDHNRPAAPGQIAKMVVTSFRNWKTPLLRYDIGDTVLLPKIQEECGCGCKMHYVEKIIGREDDLLWTEEKGYVGRMDTAYKGLEGIVKSQIIQKSPKEFIVNNVIDRAYTDKMNQKFIQNLKDRLGENIQVQINIVDDIPVGANGKFDAVKREFKINE